MAIFLWLLCGQSDAVASTQFASECGGIPTIVGSQWHVSSVLRLCSAYRDCLNRPTPTWRTHVGWGGVGGYEISDRGGPCM